mgnify:CR=1 FL=1
MAKRRYSVITLFPYENTPFSRSQSFTNRKVAVGFAKAHKNYAVVHDRKRNKVVFEKALLTAAKTRV